MSWILAFHLIFMVAWFAGLFYLPRLFVYHANAYDPISTDRFKLMEKRLFYFIMTPAALLTILFGLWLLFSNFHFYLHQHWMLTKLFCVALLGGYHFYCGRVVSNFKYNRKHQKAMFYRIFNEIPTILLILIVILAVVRPSL